MKKTDFFSDDQTIYETILDNDIPFMCVKNKTVRNDTYIWPSWHELIEVKYVLSGKMNVICDSKVFTAQKGDLVVINPYERHFINVTESDAVEYHLFLIDLSKSVTGLFFKYSFSEYLNESFRFNNLIRDERISRLFLDVIAAYEPYKKMHVVEVFARFLLFYDALHDAEIDQASRKKRHMESLSWRERIVSSALEFIYEHYTEPIKLEDLSAPHSVTKEHFCRVFKRIIGKSPGVFINELRMNKASVLLTHTDLSINEVAFKTGFVDNSYFSRCFKKYYGRSPQSFVREYKKRQPENGGERTERTEA